MKTVISTSFWRSTRPADAILVAADLGVAIAPLGLELQCPHAAFTAAFGRKSDERLCPEPIQTAERINKMITNRIRNLRLARETALRTRMSALRRIALGLSGILALLSLSLLANAQPLVQVLRSFGAASGDGTYPQVGLVQGRDGMLYGTAGGGTYANGTIFKLNPDGTGFVVLYGFTQNEVGPSRLVQGSDGALYGTTYGTGTVFKLNTDGTGYAVLHAFTGIGGDGDSPTGGLVQARDGMLYGATGGGGTNNSGTVFKLSTNGTSYTVLYSFPGSAGDGTGAAALILGSDGMLYGTRRSGGGTNNSGTVFKLNTDGTGYAVLYRFTGSADGSEPGTLVQGSDGALYGATAQSGSGPGTVFRLNTDGSGFTVLYTLAGWIGLGGDYPNTPLVQGRDGLLYGTINSATIVGSTNGGWGAVFRLSTNGTGYTILYTFNNGTYGDGYYPSAGLVQATDGMLYGTTPEGGSDENGTVFKLNADGTAYAVVHSFVDVTDKDGRSPDFMMQGSDGMLYGTTTWGGTNGGWGTVFRVSTNGTRYTLLHCFFGTDADQAEPYGLTQGPDGALYGTSIGYFGGQYGMVFKLNNDGTGFTLLHMFTGYANGDGSAPSGPLVLGRDGALYGATLGGGSYGYGTVFKLNTDGSGYTILYSFAGSGDGISGTGLVQGSDGALYGTTERGGAYGGLYSGGTVFTLNTDGSSYAVLYNFLSTPGDGQEPDLPLTQGSDGTLYGTTGYYSPTDNGTVFRLNTDGSGYSVLYRFTGGSQGAVAPSGSLVAGTDGALYGTIRGFGPYTNGAVYKLNTDGTGFTALYSFTGTGGDGANPISLMQASDGTFYGATAGGGDFGAGTVFRMGAVPPAQLTPLAPSPGGAFQFTLAGAPYLVWRVQAATNLSPPVTWITLTNLAPTNGTAQFTDPGATSFPQRFYRALWP